MADISIIIPIYNGEKWIDTCMESIAIQTVFRTKLKIEIVVYNDGSTDATEAVLKHWEKYFSNHGVKFVLENSLISKGVGFAKNGAIKKSTGEYLCFQDIDDVMHHDRILCQWEIAKTNHNSLVGSQITRHPPGSTPRLVKWANSLTEEQLKLQIYTSNGPTILMPTWFCHRSIYDRVNGFDETGLGTPEDLLFFYAHLNHDGDIYRINKKLVTYSYHEGAATFSVLRKNLWFIQLDRLEKIVLPHWESFYVWNAGKIGRRFVRALSPVHLNKVIAFCDVDMKKIGKHVELYCPKTRGVLRAIPVIHFSAAIPPIIVCMKFDLTQGQFENNLRSMNLIEGKDYIIFN